MASATLGVILPGWDVSAGADKQSASRGFGGHAEGRHCTFRFVEEGIHRWRSEPRKLVSGQLPRKYCSDTDVSMNFHVQSGPTK